MAARWQPALDDYIDLAAYLLDADRKAVAALPRIALAESALHAPFASFGGVAAYPDLTEQAAVLLEHLVKNHPLPDANKRAGLLTMARFAARRDRGRVRLTPVQAAAQRRSSTTIGIGRSVFAWYSS